MKYILFFVSLLAIGTVSRVQAQSTSAADRLYVGTYSRRGSEGIYVVQLDRKTGALSIIGTARNNENPSFLALHPSKKYLYAVNEASGGTAGANAYAIDKATGTLQLLNQQVTDGAGPCYISIDKAGKMAFVAAYGGGVFTALPIGTDGKLGTLVERVKYTGSNPANSRQDGPHAHSATVSPDSKQVYVADLGNDRVYIYTIGGTKPEPNATPFVTVKQGSGPRHMAIHPNGRFAYLVEELTSSVAVFARDPKTGSLTLIKDGIATLPADFKEQNTSADIHIDAAGKYIYQSNRGHNALAVLKVGSDGIPTLVGHVPTGGKTPRNFWLDPRGQFVIVANQDTDNLVVFKRNASTGMLTTTGQELKIPAPVCVISGQ
ncbi:lactonase family protein [uncultured Fibrella sp.]|uniref:lactonase family protein n=1 Tax=uncultured Fibrella sp. TaxID=1284596 RepID=UPI0035CA4276